MSFAKIDKTRPMNTLTTTIWILVSDFIIFFYFTFFKIDFPLHPFSFFLFCLFPLCWVVDKSVLASFTTCVGKSICRHLFKAVSQKGI